jgi:hypothetical protein
MQISCAGHVFSSPLHVVDLVLPAVEETSMNRHVNRELPVVSVQRELCIMYGSFIDHII